MTPPTPSATITTPQALLAALQSIYFPTPSSSFLHSILSNNSSSPLPSLLATAKHRLLACDMSNNSILCSSNNSFPSQISNPSIASRSLPIAIPVQVLDVQDLSRSRWEQIEAIEARERGEGVRGREIVRLVEGEESVLREGTHRLVLQDFRGVRAFALELKEVREVGLGMSMGMKMVLRPGTVVARGVVLIQPETVLVLGGKIEALHKTWVENRKKDLAAGIEAAALGQET